MNHRRYLLLILVLSTVVLLVSLAKAVPSSDFTKKNGEWYDSWGIDRNAYDGPHGYLPNLAYETLGTNKELAYSIGESFKENYASTNSRAEARSIRNILCLHLLHRKLIGDQNETKSLLKNRSNAYLSKSYLVDSQICCSGRGRRAWSKA